MNKNQTAYKRTFRTIHFVLAAIGLITCIVFATAGGHPPGILFLPMIIPAWLVAHLFIWGIRRFAIRGLHNQQDTQENNNWPPALVIAATLLAAITLTGPILFQAGLIYISIWLIIPICFIGLLLRKPWSINLIFVICFFPISFLAYDVIEILFFSQRQSHVSWISFVVAGVIYSCVLYLGVHIKRSEKVRMFISANVFEQ